MYGEHPNGGIKEVDSRNVDFLEDELPSIGEVKKDSPLYDLQQDVSLAEGEDLYTNRITEDDRLFPIEIDLSTQDTQLENEDVP